MRFIKRQPDLEKAYRETLAMIDSLVKPLNGIADSVRRIEAIDLLEEIQPHVVIALENFTKGILTNTKEFRRVFADTLAIVTDLEKRLTETPKA